MFEVTLVDGNKVQINETDVIRIQRAIYGLMRPGSKTRVNAAQQYDVLEEASTIAATVKAVLKEKFATLTLPNGNDFWFFGPAARGPDKIFPTQKFKNLGSAVIILDQRMYVANSPQEVAQVLKAAGGQVLPLTTEDSTVPNWPDQELM